MTRKHPLTVPSGNLAVSALLSNLAGRAPILYESGHGVMVSIRGDPLCVCGWDPVVELPRELRLTQGDALTRVNEHIHD